MSHTHKEVNTFKVLLFKNLFRFTKLYRDDCESKK